MDIRLLILGVCLAIKCVGFSQNSERPNILIFFTDDQGYADVGVYGAEGFETPHLDDLASEGLKFTNFYVPANVCTPSRAALLTGKYPIKVGLHSGVVSPYSTHGLEPEEITLAEVLKEGGYATSIIGKWHLGHEERYMPYNQGFDEFYGVPYSNDMDSYYYKHNDFQSPPLPFYRNEKIIGEGVDQRYLTKMYTEEAVKQIEERNTEKSFFMYVAHNMPHEPLYVSEKFEGKSDLGLYGDVIMELDWSMGQIVKALKEEGIYENTIIIFTSDNGPRIGSAKPLRGMKAETWEGGHRVPGIISWPNNIPKNEVINAVVSTLDLFPTLLDIAGIREMPNLDGRNIKKFLSNPSKLELQDEPIFFYGRNGEMEAVRYGKWKLHIAKARGWNKKKDGSFPVSLYDLDIDISESTDVSKQHSEIVEKLKKLIKEFENSLKY
ncbi:sulfatase family protein [Urechidicola vernalis]|uniref:Sulfatase n=1 Tax=Urechidicola vernalis TaxID=3075600 RepID=A0ABU2Y6J0_9FLAO|nr:sulfatase [Urechidicola sp. P050]MDT0552673.1 sulfatase [Urechidicola sp. P050]